MPRHLRPDPTCPLPPHRAHTTTKYGCGLEKITRGNTLLLPDGQPPVSKRIGPQACPSRRARQKNKWLAPCAADAQGPCTHSRRMPSEATPPITPASPHCRPARLTVGYPVLHPRKKKCRARCLPRPGRYAERAASSRPAAGRRSIAGAPHRSFFPRHTIATEHSKAQTNYSAGHDLTTGRLGCEQRHSTVLRRLAELNSASLLGPRWNVS